MGEPHDTPIKNAMGEPHGEMNTIYHANFHGIKNTKKTVCVKQQLFKTKMFTT